MSLIAILGMAGAMLVLAITPGPGVMAVLARALASGFGHAAVAALGMVCGDLIFLLAAVYGLAAIAEWLGDLFTWVRYAGGAYLIYLGLRLLRREARGLGALRVEEPSWAANFSSGLLITLGNPKVILFYLGFLPTFVDVTRLDHADVAVLALVVSVVLGSVLLGYAAIAARAREWCRSPRAMRRLNRGAGGVMVATGGVLIARS